MIQLHGITKRYGEGAGGVTALHRVDFVVEDGEFVAVMGKSGCGKTTLIHVLATLLRPDEGDYYLDGERMNGLSEKRRAEYRRRKIAVIFQNYNLVDELSVENNILLPFLFDGRTADRELFCRVADELGLGGLLHKFPAQLSGGERQRTAIARALLMKPSVILADEPTGNLDWENAAQVARMLRLCTDEHRQTVVMVTHDDEMAAVADRIVRMKDGRMFGKEKELKKGAQGIPADVSEQSAPKEGTL